MRPLLVSLAFGVLLALTLPPLPAGILAPFVLAAFFFYAAQAEGKAFVSRIFWGASALNAVHLWWLVAFVGKIFGAAPLGVLALALFALEGAFFALMAWVVSRVFRTPLGRVWGLAGGWVLLEALRFLGPFAFPWPTLGYALLDTPLIQIADLGGVLLASVLVTATAAALVSFWRYRPVPLWLMAAVWVAALSYGITRQPQAGPLRQAQVVRSTVDVFSKAGGLDPTSLLQTYMRPVQPLGSGERLILPETAVRTGQLLSGLPAGIYGLGDGGNKVVAWTGQALTSGSDKARPVPFGEYFPLRRELDSLWRVIEKGVGFYLESIPPAREVHPLPLGDVHYGGYICYDSVFPWVARQLTQKGAQVLVNVSNDGWYAGWGVEQHFAMGRVRAIENRRWVLRSVNEGIAGSVNDLGQPVRTLSRGEGALHLTFPALGTQTLYSRLGDWPALLLATLLLMYGLRAGAPVPQRPRA